MSTNYYIKDSLDFHLGKRYSAGNGKLGFIWARNIELIAFSELMVELGFQSLDNCIVNEYGDEMSIIDFIQIAYNCDIQDTDSIGKEFS